MLKRLKEALPTYLIAIALPLVTGVVSALITRENMDIYRQFNMPPLAPPAWLFPVVWTVLYVLMGISSAIIFLMRDKNPDVASRGLSYYLISLVFNFAWSIIFFNLRSLLFAFLWLLLLFYFVLRTILSYSRVSPLAACLQIPYILWVAFAGYLNLAIYLLN